MQQVAYCVCIPNCTCEGRLHSLAEVYKDYLTASLITWSTCVTTNHEVAIFLNIMFLHQWEDFS